MLIGCGGEGGGENVNPVTNEDPEPIQTNPLPSAPTNLQAVAISSDQIDLSWDAPADNNVMGYDIYRDGEYLDSVSDCSYSDIGLSAALQYCYRISSYNDINIRSVLSTQFFATTLPISTAPSTPGYFRYSLSEEGTTIFTTNLTLSWEAVQGAARYNIYSKVIPISTAPPSELPVFVSKTDYGEKKTVFNTSYTTELRAGLGHNPGPKYYFFRITAKNNYGESEMTHMVQIYCVMGACN